MKTHDYTTQTWGHAFSTLAVMENGMRLSLAGHGSGIAVGDFLIIPNGKETTRYKVEKINYRMDPPDMWFAELTFAPRPREFNANNQ